MLRSLGVEEDLAHSSLRFGIGRFTTEKEASLFTPTLSSLVFILLPPFSFSLTQSQIDYTIDILSKSVSRLRDMSPLWEMVQDGIDLKSIKWTQH